MLINRNALQQITGLQGDDIIVILQENTKQKNAGNKGITVDNFVTAIESEIDDVTGNLEIDGTLDVTGAVDFAGALTVDTITEHTANAGVTIEAVKLENGGVTNAGETQIAGFFPLTAAQSLSGAGAVNVTSYLTKYTSTGGAEALTIASGTQIGQRKKVQHVVDGGSGVLTGVFVGGTTITFTAVAEFCDLIWTGAAWAVLELGNTAAPGTPPVLA